MAPPLSEHDTTASGAAGYAAPAWVRRLIEPSAAVTSREDQRRARLSAVLTILLLVVGLPYMAISYGTNWFGERASFADTTGLIDLASMLVLVAAYWLSRTRFHQAGILVAVLMIDGAIWALWGTAAPAEAADMLYYVAIPFVVAAFILEFLLSAAFVLANIAAFVFAVGLSVPARSTYLGEYLYVGFFLLVVAVLVQAGGYLYQADQRRLELQTARLSVSEARFRATTENLPQSVFIVEPDLSRTYYASAGYEAIWGRPVTDLYANPWAWLAAVAPDEQARLKASLGTGAPTGLVEQEFHILRPDGSRRAVRNRVFPIPRPDGGPPLLAGITEDVTDYEEAQRILRESNEVLKSTDAFRAQMLHAVAHDLQSPLTPIKIQVELLRGKAGETPESRAHALAIIDRNADYVSNLVQQLRDVATLTTGPLKLRRGPVDLATTAQETAASFRAVADGRSVAVVVDAPVAVRVVADAQRVTQLFYNLVGNALKFTPTGGTVKIRVAAEDGGAAIRVTDTGRGLAPEEVPRLFQAFSQVHKPGEIKERGTGLGLFICKGIATNHGGRVWAESAGLGQGSSFVAWLPTA